MLKMKNEHLNPAAAIFGVIILLVVCHCNETSTQQVPTNGTAMINATTNTPTKTAEGEHYWVLLSAAVLALMIWATRIALIKYDIKDDEVGKLKSIPKRFHTQDCNDMKCNASAST